MSFGHLWGGFGRLGYRSGNSLAWIPNPSNRPDIAINWTTNQAWLKTTGLTTPAALGIATSRASVKQVVDSLGNWSQVAANVTAQSNLGRSTEEARTNSIRNNSMVGAVVGTVGSGGAWPTNWGPGGGVFSGLTVQILATGTQNGINYIDARVFGTTNSTGTNLFLEGSAVVTASTGQVWDQSVFFAVMGGTTTNITSIVQNLIVAGGGATSPAGSSDIKGQTALARNDVALTLSGTVTSIRPSITFNFNNAAAVDITFRIGWPQLELGASVTSPIITSGSAATRAADVTTLAGLAGGSAYTLLEKFTPQAPNAYTASQFTLGFSDGTTANISAGTRTTTGANLVVETVAGVSQTVPAATAVASQGSLAKWAASFASGNISQVLNGGTVTTSAPASIATSLTTAVFGSNGGGANQLDGLATIDAIWLTQALSSATLQTITT